MLEALRKGASGWVAKIFIGLLVLSFAVWGIADIFGGFGAGTVATVGETRLLVEDYRRAYQDELQRLRLQFRGQLSNAQARALGAEQRALSRLVSEAAIDNHARDLALGISDAAIAERVRRNPAFQGADGRFSRFVFNERLARLGLTEAGYIARERNDAIRGQITNTLAGGILPPEPLVEAINQYQNETRKIAYFKVPLAKAKAPAEPDEAALKRYWEDHKPQFTAPEYRKLDILLATPDALKDAITISEKDLRAEYEARKAGFVTPERRRVYQITFPDKAAAEAAYKELEAGKDFLALAKERGIEAKDADLGTLTRKDFVDPKIRDAAFALEKGAYSRPIEGMLTVAIVKVTEITPEKKRTFEEVKKELEADLRRRRAREKLLDIHDKVEDERAAGATLAEIAKKLGLKRVLLAAVDRIGKDKAGKAVAGVAGLNALLRVAFESDVGVENDPVELSGGGFGWVDVLEVIPQAVRPFAEVRDKVRAAYLESERQKALGKLAQEYAEKVRAGGDMAKLAKELGSKLEVAEGVKRGTRIEGLPQAAITHAFSLAEGEVGVARSADGKARIVFRVEAIEPASPLEAEARKGLEDQLARLLAGDVVEQYLEALRQAYPVRVNETNLRRVTGANAP